MCYKSYGMAAHNLLALLLDAASKCRSHDRGSGPGKRHLGCNFHLFRCHGVMPPLILGHAFNKDCFEHCLPGLIVCYRGSRDLEVPSLVSCFAFKEDASLITLPLILAVPSTPKGLKRHFFRFHRRVMYLGMQILLTPTSLFPGRNPSRSQIPAQPVASAAAERAGARERGRKKRRGSSS